MTEMAKQATKAKKQSNKCEIAGQINVAKMN